MKRMKAAGIIFIIVGLVFLIVGTIECITAFQKTEERIYTTATIVRIEEYETGDPEQPIRHETYVEFEIDGKKTESELNTYNSSFKKGKEIEIYYFNDDINFVYEKGSEFLLILFPIFGTAFIVLGALLAFYKKLPSSE